VVPAYREAESLSLSLGRIIEALRAANIPFEIILIVDRAPGDDTAEVARRIASDHPEVHLMIREGRQGVGTAIRAGISMAHGEIVMPVMADASESTSDVVAVARKAQEGYDIVVGNRFIVKKIFGYPALKYCANRLCNLLVRLLFRVPTSDITNAFKAYSTKALEGLDINSRGYSVFLELPVKAYMNSSRCLTELPVRHTATSKKRGLRVFRDGVSYILSLLGILFYN